MRNRNPFIRYAFVALLFAERGGINSDATLATREKGEKVPTAIVQDIITFVEHFEQMPLLDEQFS